MRRLDLNQVHRVNAGLATAAAFHIGFQCALMANMRRKSRRTVAALALLGFLFLQGAAAAHACSVVFNPLRGAVVNANASTHDCAGTVAAVNKAPALLCLQHCNQGDEASNTSSSADVPGPVSIAFLVVEAAAMDAPIVSRASTRFTVHGTSPPPLSLSQRLRI